jgi:hypothetical protein
VEKACHDRELIEATSLKAYFHEELNGILDRLHQDLSDDTRAYMVNLLHQFSRSDQFYEWYEERVTLRPLAMLYGEALHARNLHERRQMLRRLGDIALFIAGLFGPSLERKCVGVEYYINMGGSAYDWLSDSLSATRDRSLQAQTFREMALNFEEMVMALDALAACSGMRGNPEFNAIKEQWRELPNQPSLQHATVSREPATGNRRTWH